MLQLRRALSFLQKTRAKPSPPYSALVPERNEAEVSYFSSAVKVESARASFCARCLGVPLLQASS